MGYLFQNSKRHFMLEEFTALRYMENGLILHLTNLDDDSSTYSFRQILKATSETYKGQKGIKDLKKKFEFYCKNINGLQLNHRNNRIAHLNYPEDLSFDEFLNFDYYLKPLIAEAKEIGDFVFVEKVDNRFKLGTYEGVLNFRDIFETLKFDVNGQREFV